MEFNYEYIFAVMISALLFRMMIILQFNEILGPLINIVIKMGGAFYNFFILYCILILMFSFVGNMNFGKKISEFDTFSGAFLTVFQASFGNFDLRIYNKAEE
jgi:presenilin-like A22 family membrane protease